MRFRARSVGTTKLDDTKQVVLENGNLTAADFSGRTLLQFAAAGCRFEHCRFDGTTIESASFGGGRTTSEYIECSFDGAHVRFGPGGYARFVGCSFRDVDLQDWFCFTVELIECTFTGRLEKAIFNGTVPQAKRVRAGRQRNEFYGNNFSGMRLIDVGFRSGIDLSRQQLPTGPDYVYVADARQALAHARANLTDCQDEAIRQPALTLIQTFEDDVAAGQRQLLLRPADYSGLPQPVVNAVISLIGTPAAE